MYIYTHLHTYAYVYIPKFVSFKIRIIFPTSSLSSHMFYENDIPFYTIIVIITFYKP